MLEFCFQLISINTVPQKSGSGIDTLTFRKCFWQTQGKMVQAFPLSMCKVKGLCHAFKNASNVLGYENDQAQKHLGHVCFHSYESNTYESFIK